MTEINRLSAADELGPNDAVPIFSRGSGDARRVTAKKFFDVSTQAAADAVNALTAVDGASRIGTSTPGVTVQAALDNRWTNPQLIATDGATKIGTPTGTVQDGLDARPTASALAAADGAAGIGFLQAGTGAGPRTLQAKEREFVSVTDFFANGVSGPLVDPTGVIDSTLGIAAALAASNNVYVPEGDYLVSALVFDKNYQTFTGAGLGRTRFIMTAAANVALSIGKNVNASHISLSGFSLEGNATNIGAIKFGTSTLYAANVKLRDLFIEGFTNTAAGCGYAYQLCSVQELDVFNCWTTGNTYSVHRPTGGYCTAAAFHGKGSYLGHNSKNAILLDGHCYDITFDGPVIEGNALEAIVVKNTAVDSGIGSRVFIQNCYFEANLNSGAGNGVIQATGGAGTNEQHKLVLTNSPFIFNVNGPVGQMYLVLDAVNGYIAGCLLPPLYVQTTATCSVRFDSNRPSTSGNGFAQYRNLLGSIQVTDTTLESVSGTNVSQVNLFNNITFPATAKPVSDANTLDDYREGTWTPTLNGFTGTVGSPVGRYTKIGRQVFFDLSFSATTASNALWTTASIGGLPFTPTALGMCGVLNASTGADLGNAYITTASGIIFPVFTSNTGTVVLSGRYQAT
jgi:hypothetical protein